MFSSRCKPLPIVVLVALLIANCCLSDAFFVPKSRRSSCVSGLMMGAGFGSSKGGASKSTEKKSSEKKNTVGKISAGSDGAKSASKGDGASYIKHCPSMDRKFLNIRCINNDPPIFEIDDFLPSSVCDEFIVRAEKEGVVVPSQTFSADSGSKRTSSTWYLPYAAVPELLDGATRLTGLSISTFEEPQVVRYEIGQQFSWHYDAIPNTLQVRMISYIPVETANSFQILLSASTSGARGRS